MAKWLELISEYPCSGETPTWVQFGNADGLSRRLCPQCELNLEQNNESARMLEREEEIARWPYIRNIQLLTVYDSIRLDRCK